MTVMAMEKVRFDCDCDLVVEMEEARVGVQEILQYSKAVLSRDQVRALIRGLEEIIADSADDEE